MSLPAQRLREAGEAFRNGDGARAGRIWRELVEDPSSPAEIRGRAGYALAVLLYTDGRAHEARTVLAPVLESLGREYGEDSPAVLRVMVLLARCHIAVDDFDAGIPMAREAVERLSASDGADTADLAAACFFLSSAEYQTGRLDEAERLTLRAMSLFRQMGGHEADISTCLNNLGRICEERGDMEQGISWLRESVALHQRTFGTHPQTALALGNLGVALASTGHFAEAVSQLEECLKCYAECGITSGREVEGYRHNCEICRRALAEGTSD